MQAKFMNFINVLLNKVWAIQNISLLLVSDVKELNAINCRNKAKSITLSIVDLIVYGINLSSKDRLKH